MIVPSSLADREAALHRRVVERQLSSMESAIESYCELANMHLSTLAADPAERAEFLKHVIGVFEWAHLMLRVTRAGYADQLTHLQLARRYLTPGTQQSALRMDG